MFGEFVDPREVDKKQPARILGRGVEAIKIHRLAPVVGPHTYEVALVAHHIDKFELLEQGSHRSKAFPHLGTRLYGDAERRRIVKNEAHEGVTNRSFGKVGYIEI